ncbi:hypothetical protein CORC01_00879 [Colletotrichum orchidophilum]|uniref:Uncharacterized protein n=1 Tax=Colletotrichum orchidophilum TaxID=1209926 RepID=A0A1G4BRW8_9PEZI|nr:uncharacterized protein CORC01_00879 [Colletotrichum orchidophilum]OHF04017.1 hypothetical protein CORC01_00879 [Colletotrichum orchidophilum]
MDNTPLHPDITTLPPDTGQRHGDFLTAIPYNRSMYRTTLLLRLASILDAVIILGALAAQHPEDYYYLGNWAFGCPTAAMACLWSLGDIAAMLVRDRGFRWTKNDPTKLPRSTKFSWGSPGGHVSAHLLIWTPTVVFMCIITSNWLQYENDYNFGHMDQRHTNVVAALIFFMFILTMIHFALFIFAIVDVDNERRHYSDVVFIPRGELCEMVPVPPTTPWEIFSPRKLLLSYFANHYVRFVPGADGTVTVARDYSSRQARF